VRTLAGAIVLALVSMLASACTVGRDDNRRIEPATGMVFVRVPTFTAESAGCGLRYTHRPQDRGFSIGVRLVRD
jgi:hypothetical protein